MRRLQFVLELLKEQRDLHIARLQSRHDARLCGGQRGFTFTDEDMKEVFNTWRKDPSKWMTPDNLSKYHSMWGDWKHDFLKRRFAAMKFQLLGNAALVDITIRCNLIGAVQPAALREFMDRWTVYLQTPACLRAREASEPKPSWQPRRYTRVKELREQIERAKTIKEWIEADRNNWNVLTDSDQRLHQAYCSGALHDELKAFQAIPKGTAFRGGASNIMSAGQPNSFNSIR